MRLQTALEYAEIHGLPALTYILNDIDRMSGKAPMEYYVSVSFRHTDSEMRPVYPTLRYKVADKGQFFSNINLPVATQVVIVKLDAQGLPQPYPLALLGEQMLQVLKADGSKTAP